MCQGKELEASVISVYLTVPSGGGHVPRPRSFSLQFSPHHPFQEPTDFFALFLNVYIYIYILKIYFYYFFIGKTDIQRVETERKIFRPTIHSPSEHNRPILCRSEARSLLRVSHAGAGSQSFGPSSTAFPGHRQGAGREAGLPGLEPAPIWDPGSARRGPLTTCATAPGPQFVDFLKTC